MAVALGLATFSLGTDTAGSGRVPASLNNLVGLKPTRGVLSNSGLVPACKTLDCISIFGLSVPDTLLVYHTVAAFDAADPYARPATAAARKALSSSPIIGVPLPEQLQCPGNASAEKLFEESVARCVSLGWTVKRLDFSPFLEAARLLYHCPWVAERYAAAESLITTQPEALHPVTRQIIGSGAAPSALDAFKSQYRLAELKRTSEAAWTEVDAILTPTAGDGVHRG